MSPGENDEQRKTSGPDQASQPRSGLMRAWMYGALAMEFTATVVGGGVLGYLLDRWWSMQPIWTIVLSLIGFAGGIALFLRGLARLESR